MLLPLLALLLPACTGNKTSDSPADSAGDDDTGDPLPLPTERCGYTPATDLDPADDVVAVDLAQAPFEWDPGTGTMLTDGLAYNAEIPGPVLELDLGQTLRAEFTNGLEYDSTVHWHGFRAPDAMDGAARMIDMVPAGGSFTYEIPMVDAGFYWYHPHMATEQDLERGLYGRIIVHHPDEPRVDCDLPVVLDDILLDEDTMQIAPKDTEHMQLMGRLGNLILANGRSDRRVEVKAGETMLLRLVNAANARHFDLTLEGQQMRVVGTDGGWLGEEVPVDHLVVSPGERYIVAVDWVGAPGDELRLMSARFQLHAEDAHMVEYDPMGEGENPVMTFVIGDEAGTPTPMTLPSDDLPSFTGEEPLVHTWVLDEDMENGIVTVDGFSYPDVPEVQASADVAATFVVQNDSEMHHPFHIHGNRFQVLDVDGIPPALSGWKDTFDIPPYASVTLASEMDNPGDWMYHCHILEHAELGMAGMLMVEDGMDDGM
ncbi:MAG: multicopper oxidase family protein [Pseudomonadota bacterium]|nr:multicopper oxidase family protein [Pseudomonadota bacterium]